MLIVTMPCLMLRTFSRKSPLKRLRFSHLVSSFYHAFSLLSLWSSLLSCAALLAPSWLIWRERISCIRLFSLFTRTKRLSPSLLLLLEEKELILLEAPLLFLTAP